MNNWNFIGNLGSDAELRTTTQGKSVLSFDVAVTTGYGDNAETTWVKCQLWNKPAESMGQYLTKGRQVAVVGEVTLRKYQKRDGTPAQSLDVRVTSLKPLGGRDEAQAPAQQRQAPRQPAPKPAPQHATDFDDDIPF